MRYIPAVLIGAALAMGAPSARAGQAAPMTAAQIGALVTALDPEATANGHGWFMKVEGRIALLAVDEPRARLRVMVPVRRSEGLTAAQLKRMLEANFDSGVDARYALARGLVWTVFTHPLRTLDKTQLIAGMAQAVTLAQSHGTLYSGGTVPLEEGEGAHRELLEDLLSPGAPL